MEGTRFGMKWKGRKGWKGPARNANARSALQLGRHRPHVAPSRYRAHVILSLGRFLKVQHSRNAKGSKNTLKSWRQSTCQALVALVALVAPQHAPFYPLLHSSLAVRCQSPETAFSFCAISAVSPGYHKCALSELASGLEF